MATTKTTRKTTPAKRTRRPSSTSATTRQRTTKKTQHPVARSRTSVRSVSSRTGRALGAPLKEALFVSIGLVDWMAEMLWVMEKEFARRGEHRSKSLRTAASRAGAATSRRTAALYTDAKEGFSSVTETMGDGVRRMSRRIPLMQPA